MSPKQRAITDFFGKQLSYKAMSSVKRARTSPSSSSSPEKKRTHSDAPSTDSAFVGTSAETSPGPDQQAHQQESSPLEKVEIIVKDDWPNPELSPIFSTLIEPKWRSLLESELKKDYLKSICQFLEQQFTTGATVFPPRDLIFNAFNLTPFHEIRVVLLGQDPYHNVSQAHGLCFSVPKGVSQPPSLRNIFKELSSEYPDFKVPTHGCLESWARQGVFMLNASLTVQAHKANSHSEIGWQHFTNAVIKLISDKAREGVVFLLWGGFAQRKESLVDKKKHRIIKAAHPSPLSAYRFAGCKCFSKTNAMLKELGREPIDWNTLFDE